MAAERARAWPSNAIRANAGRRHRANRLEGRLQPRTTSPAAVAVDTASASPTADASAAPSAAICPTTTARSGPNGAQHARWWIATTPTRRACARRSRTSSPEPARRPQRPAVLILGDMLELGAVVGRRTRRRRPARIAGSRRLRRCTASRPEPPTQPRRRSVRSSPAPWRPFPKQTRRDGAVRLARGAARTAPHAPRGERARPAQGIAAASDWRKRSRHCDPPEHGTDGAGNGFPRRSLYCLAATGVSGREHGSAFGIRSGTSAPPPVCPAPKGPDAPIRGRNRPRS